MADYFSNELASQAFSNCFSSQFHHTVWILYLFFFFCSCISIFPLCLCLTQCPVCFFAHAVSIKSLSLLFLSYFFLHAVSTMFYFSTQFLPCLFLNTISPVFTISLSTHRFHHVSFPKPFLLWLFLHAVSTMSISPRCFYYEYFSTLFLLWVFLHAVSTMSISPRCFYYEYFSTLFLLWVFLHAVSTMSISPHRFMSLSSYRFQRYRGLSPTMCQRVLLECVFAGWVVVL